MEKMKERRLIYASIVVSVIAVVVACASLAAPHATYVTNNYYTTGNAPATLSNGTATTTIAPATGYDISSALLTPPTSLSDAPVITQVQAPGKSLTDLNEPLNASELSAINNAPDSYFETAGEMFLNGTLKNNVGIPTTKVPMFVVNGKPSVIYVGSITCVWCAANRWSMALALSRFGNFTYLFKGYSALEDGDAPTLYWTPAHYNETSVAMGSFYSSKYINFLPYEESAPISGGFSLQPLGALQQYANATGNLAYIDGVKYVISINSFEGTPYSVWDGYVAAGADAHAFGNNSQSTSLLNMTHEQMLQQLADPSSQLAWTEYAGADYYSAMICKSLNNTAPVCALNAIKTMEASLGS
jgi:hypothetical protein